MCLKGKDGAGLVALGVWGGGSPPRSHSWLPAFRLMRAAIEVRCELFSGYRQGGLAICLPASSWGWALGPRDALSLEVCPVGAALVAETCTLGGTPACHRPSGCELCPPEVKRQVWETGCSWAFSGASRPSCTG